MLKFLRNCQTVFQIGCSILYNHQQCMNDPASPHPCQHLVSPLCFILAYFDRCGMIPHCGFNLHFPDG